MLNACTHLIPGVVVWVQLGLFEVLLKLRIKASERRKSDPDRGFQAGLRCTMQCCEGVRKNKDGKGRKLNLCYINPDMTRERTPG